MSILSIVVARKNSKGLKNKTILKINNKYVFEYSVEYSLGLESVVNAEVLTAVSSDCEVIEKYCLNNGIMFIKRNPVLATDTARIEDVMYDACLKINENVDYISLVYANMPIRYPDEFAKAFCFLERNSDFDAVLSMQDVGRFNPEWMFKYNENILTLKKRTAFRRQHLKRFIIHDGHTILVRSKYFLEFMRKQKTNEVFFEPFGRKIKPIINDKLIVEIDSESDFQLVEAMLEKRSNKVTSV